MHATTTSSQSFGRRLAAAVVTAAVGVTLFAGAWASSHGTDDSSAFKKHDGRKIAAGSNVPKDRRWTR
jgi:hypothetical protein